MLRQKKIIQIIENFEKKLFNDSLHILKIQSSVLPVVHYVHLPIVTPPTTIRHNRVVKNRKEKIIHSSFIISLFLTLCDSAAEARADWPVACRCSENSEFEAVQSSVVLFTRGER